MLTANWSIFMACDKRKYDSLIPIPKVGISKGTFLSLKDSARSRKHLSPMSPNILKGIPLTKSMSFFKPFPVDSSLDCVQIEALALSALKKCFSFLNIFNILKTRIVFSNLISNSSVVCLQCFNLKRDKTFRAFEIEILKPSTKEPNCRQ